MFLQLFLKIILLKIISARNKALDGHWIAQGRPISARKWDPVNTCCQQYYIEREWTLNDNPKYKGKQWPSKLTLDWCDIFGNVSLDINMGQNWHILRISAMQWGLGSPLACLQPG